jgi:hypothetical protein
MGFFGKNKLRLIPVANNRVPCYHSAMSRHKKLIERFLTKPKNFTWDELVTMLHGFEYELTKGSKTGGSRARFVHERLPPITLHKPHPSPLLKRYQIEQLENFLREEGLV